MQQQEKTYPILLPKGYQDGKGEMHRAGEMRKGTPQDEVLAMLDPRSRQQEGFGLIILLSRVIQHLGTLENVDETIIASLAKEDIEYLKEQYRIINEA